MQVLLWQDIEKLGKRGETVNVASGYFRNYLRPRRMATLPTDGMKKALEIEAKKIAAKEAKVIENRKELAAILSKISVEVAASANDEGSLYGAITPAMLVDVLKKKHNLVIDPKIFDMSKDIKQIGSYEIKVNLLKDQETLLKIQVVKKEIEKEDQIKTKN